DGNTTGALTTTLDILNGYKFHRHSRWLLDGGRHILFTTIAICNQHGVNAAWHTSQILRGTAITPTVDVRSHTTGDVNINCACVLTIPGNVRNLVNISDQKGRL